MLKHVGQEVEVTPHSCPIRLLIAFKTCSNPCKSLRRVSQLAPEDPGIMPLLEVFLLSYMHPRTLALGQLGRVGDISGHVPGTFVTAAKLSRCKCL